MSVKAILGSSLLSCTLALAVLVSPVAVPREASATVIIGGGSSLNHGRGISCPQGARLLRTRGFRGVRQVDCRGRYFTYRGVRRGVRYEVAIRQRDGRIVDQRRTNRR
ncbi:hypothetical protein H4W29_003929 [Rhizobium viscosum]|uniref:Antifreeze protein n=1 Tax=Rhizobium viscosum TaxID=1673 RepID=A0ABR9IU85_RHIVS|nr:hypothetical protein [Rhizobium viscosum]